MSIPKLKDLNEVLQNSKPKLIPPLDKGNAEEAYYILHMSFLKEVVVALLNANLDRANDIIFEWRKAYSSERKQYEDDVDALYWGSNRETTSYMDYIGLALEALTHKNMGAFHGLVVCIHFKISQWHQLFFNDFPALKPINEELNEYLGIFGEEEFEPIKFERYDVECKKYPCLSSGHIYTDRRSVTLMPAKYCSLEDGTLNTKEIEADFNRCVEEGSMREFLVPMRNTYFQSVTDQPDFFFYYACALMLDFSATQNIFSWNEYLSREVCRSVILLSKTLDSSSKLYYEAKMEYYLDAIMRLVSNIVKLIESFRTETAARISLFRIGEFLINLSYIFPFYNGAIELLASFNEHPLLDGEGFSSLSYVLSHEALVWMMRRDGKDPFSDTDSTTQSAAPCSTSESVAADNEERSRMLPDKENSSGCLASLCAFAFLSLVSLGASILFAI